MEKPTIREAVAVFDDAEKLEGAVSELQSNGIDRSELSFLAHPSLAGHIPGTCGRQRTIRPHRASRWSAIRTCGKGACSGLVSPRPLRRLPQPGSLSPPAGRSGNRVAAAVAAGGVGAASTLFGRKLAEDQTSFLDAQLARGGVLLWVRTRDAASEQTVLEVLRRRSEHVYLHDLPAEAAALH